MCRTEGLFFANGRGELGMRKRCEAGIAAVLSVLLFGVVLLPSAGCGSATPGLLDVSGRVTVDGQPAEGAVLLFHPEGAPQGTVSSAVAQPDGTFRIVTDGNQGIPEGRYRVTATWPDPAVKPSEGGGGLGEGFGLSFEPGPDLLNGRYVSRDKSDLSVTIEKGTKELQPFELQTR
jgi:hypothetical protein